MFLLKIIAALTLFYLVYKIARWFSSGSNSDVSLEWFWDQFDDNGDSNDGGDSSGGGDSGGGD